MCSIPHSQLHHRQSSDELSREDDEDPYYSGMNTWPAKGHAHNSHAHRGGKPCLMQHFPPPQPLPPPPPPLHSHDHLPSYFICSKSDLRHEDTDHRYRDDPPTIRSSGPWVHQDNCCRGRF